MSEMMPLAAELSQVYARMSGLLLSEATVHTATDLVTSLALDTIAGATGAGVTLVDADGAKESAGATSELVAHADDLQYQLGEGPCLTAIAHDVLVQIDDLESDDRWPRWRDAVLPTGLHSSLSAPLRAEGRVLGALKIYGERSGAFDDRSADLLSRFAEQAAILLANVGTLDKAERLSENLRTALRSRNLIALANGVLMERFHLTEEQAFLRLVDGARSQARELVDEATVVVQSAWLEHE